MVKRFFLSSLRAMLLFCILVSPAHPAAAPSPVAQAAPSTPAVPAPVLSAQAVPAPVLSAPTVPAPTPVSAAPLSVVVKSTANRGETNVGDYWIGEDFAAGFQTLGATTDMDYRGEYHRPHSPEPALNLYMRGYTDFIPPFPSGCNVLYAYYPMAYTVPSAQASDTADNFSSVSARNAAPIKAAAAGRHPLSKSALNRRPPQPQNANLDDDWQNFDVIAVASLMEMSAVILPEGITMEGPSLEKAREEGVAVLQSKKSAYALCALMEKGGLPADTDA